VADSRASANATAERTTPPVGHAGRTPTDGTRLLPTPRATDGAKGSPGQHGSHGDLTLPSAAVQVAKVLPTPTVSDGRGPGVRSGGSNLRTTVTTLPPDPASSAGPGGPVPDPARWGVYADAVAHWEALLDRPAPDPTQPGTHGKPVLAPPFVEWLMGLDRGWVTDLGLPRTLALKVLGNGVVPQQAATALRLLLCPHRWAAHR
jgi:DNA (cytosine-5)-methyltransferase 1